MGDNESSTPVTRDELYYQDQADRRSVQHRAKRNSQIPRFAALAGLIILGCVMIVYAGQLSLQKLPVPGFIQAGIGAIIPAIVGVAASSPEEKTAKSCEHCGQ